MKNEIPFEVRRALDVRDGRYCRMCGVYAGTSRQHHHIVFGGTDRGTGGRRVHEPTEMISLCLGCHERAHREKSRWRSLLLEVIDWPGYTAMQLERWHESKERHPSARKERS